MFGVKLHGTVGKKETAVAPLYYKNFRCAASKCEDSCCRGWKIAIDQKTWKKYRSLGKKDKRWVQKGLDHKMRSFRIADGKCVFLDEKSLCKLQKTFGEEMLCDTCRRYPRHMEEYEGLKEFSLSLSCPEAARMILGERQKLRFACTVRQTQVPRRQINHSYYKEKKLLRTLLEIRNDFFEVAQDRTRKVEERMGRVLLAATQMQKAIDRGEMCLQEKIKEAIDWEWIDEKMRAVQRDTNRREQRFVFVSSCCEIFAQLEPIQNDWRKEMEERWRALYSDGIEEYEKKRAQFQREDSELVGEKFFIYFLFVYFLGGIYDRQFDTKVKLGIFGWIVIREWAIMKRDEKGMLTFEDWVELAYRYAREVEHSDQNLELLESIFQGHEMFAAESILPALYSL